MKKNQRKFFRVYFDYLEDGTISSEDGELIAIKIDNLSVEGMGFITTTFLEEKENIICNFTILDKSYSLEGIVVRKTPKPGYYYYGAMFKVDQKMASDLFKQLNYYQISKRKTR